MSDNVQKRMIYKIKFDIIKYIILYAYKYKISCDKMALGIEPFQQNQDCLHLTCTSTSCKVQIPLNLHMKSLAHMSIIIKINTNHINNENASIYCSCYVFPMNSNTRSTILSPFNCCKFSTILQNNFPIYEFLNKVIETTLLCGQITVIGYFET